MCSQLTASFQFIRYILVLFVLLFTIYSRKLFTFPHVFNKKTIDVVSNHPRIEYPTCIRYRNHIKIHFILIVILLTYNNLPDIQVPLNRAGGGSFKNISSKEGLSPFVLGPSSGGETNTILKTIRPSTATITNKAINIPLQFLSLGELITNS